MHRSYNRADGFTKSLCTVTERARKLRAQYMLQAQGLRTRIEIRVNRIPMALRKANMGDLWLKYGESATKPMIPKAQVSPRGIQSPPAQPGHNNTRANPSPLRGMKRLRSIPSPGLLEVMLTQAVMIYHPWIKRMKTWRTQRNDHDVQSYRQHVRRQRFKPPKSCLHDRRTLAHFLAHLYALLCPQESQSLHVPYPLSNQRHQSQLEGRPAYSRTWLGRPNLGEAR